MNKQDFNMLAANRDPRIDPIVGDEIKQSSTGYHLRVIHTNKDIIQWQRKTKTGWSFENSWTLGGWREFVAKNAIIVHKANTAEPGTR